MDPHPLPPTDQAGIDKIALTLAHPRHEWYRVFRTKQNPLWFGKKGIFRFDAPGGEYGVLYIAAKPDGAFIETFGRTLGIRLIRRQKLEARSIAVLKIKGLSLVDLTASGASKAGVDARISAGEYDLSQAWSRAFHAHARQPDGILYRARHDSSQVCAAFYERAASKIEVLEQIDLSTRKGQQFIAPILERYEFGVTGRPRPKG